MSITGAGTNVAAAAAQNRNQTAVAATQKKTGSVENASQNPEKGEVEIIDSSFMQNAVPRAQVDSIMSQGQSLMGSNKFDEAAVFFRRAADLDPSDSTAHHYAEMAHYKSTLTKFITSAEGGQESGSVGVAGQNTLAE